MVLHLVVVLQKLVGSAFQSLVLLVLHAVLELHVLIVFPGLGHCVEVVFVLQLLGPVLLALAVMDVLGFLALKVLV